MCNTAPLHCRSKHRTAATASARHRTDPDHRSPFSIESAANVELTRKSLRLVKLKFCKITQECGVCIQCPPISRRIYAVNTRSRRTVVTNACNDASGLMHPNDG